MENEQNPISTTQTPAPADYTLTFDEGEYRFRRPTTPQVQRYLKKVNDDVVKASAVLMNELVVPEQKQAWADLTSDTRKPGYPTAAANYILKKLGFVGNDLGD